jgi:hypothetical protein
MMSNGNATPGVAVVGALTVKLLSSPPTVRVRVVVENSPGLAPLEQPVIANSAPRRSTAQRTRALSGALKVIMMWPSGWRWH